MEYYQRMAKMKLGNKCSNAKSVTSFRLSTSAPTSVASNSSAISTQDVNAQHLREQNNPRSTSNLEVAQWLLSYLPHLHEEDVSQYSKCLIDDGFDSAAFIEEELTEEDIFFMKKAHRRVLMRQLIKLRAEG